MSGGDLLKKTNLGGIGVGPGSMGGRESVSLIGSSAKTRSLKAQASGLYKT